MLILDLQRAARDYDRGWFVKSNEFKRWLAAQGATFAPGKGSHLKIELHGKLSYLPMHSKELGTGLVETIKKQLGLKQEKQ
jgi:mRNA interferase HicA